MRSIKSLFLVILLLSSFEAIPSIYFSYLEHYLTGSEAQVVAIGDFNNDKLNDVAVTTNYYSSFPTDNYALIIFYQDTLGKLSIPVRYHYAFSGPFAETIATGNFNNDSLLDIVIGYGDSIAIYFQDSLGINGNKSAYYSGSWQIESVKAGDLNNDSLMDIVVAHNNESYIRVFYQDSSGFSSITYPDTLAIDKEIDIGDVNGDGLNDVILIAGYLHLGIRVYYQDSLGHLNDAIPFYTNSVPTIYLEGIAVGDLNNDGKKDVVGAGGGNYPDAKTIIWYQDTLATLQSPLNFVSFDIPEAAEIADLNNDNKSEIVEIHGGWRAFSVFEQDSLGNFSVPNVFYTGSLTSHFQNQGMVVGDVNNDGWKDVVYADGSVITIAYGDSSLISGVFNKNVEKDMVLLFPNPANDILQITFMNNFDLKSIEIFDLLSKKQWIEYGINNSGHLLINISFLKAGMYFIKLSDGNNQVVKSFIKQ